MTKALADKIAVVTGAGKGIGRETVLVLAGAGATVVALDIDEKLGAETARLAQVISPKSIFMKLDVVDVDASRRVLRAIDDRFGSVDVLVNNAGITRQMNFFDIDENDMDQIIDVNLKGAFFVMQAAARAMRREGAGCIVNVASIAGKGFRKTSNICYAGSKGGVIAMTRVAAAQLGQFGIRVNSVCPGLTETEILVDWMNDRAAELGQNLDELKSDLMQDMALKRINSANDVAQAILYMASPMSQNVTGQSINVDSGIMWD